MIQQSSLPDAIRTAAQSEIAFDLPATYSGKLDFDRFKEETEKEFIVQALKANRGRINQTVAQLTFQRTLSCAKSRSTPSMSVS